MSHAAALLKTKLEALRKDNERLAGDMIEAERASLQAQRQIDTNSELIQSFEDALRKLEQS